MHSHPIIKAIFDEDSCDPSKQLLAVRERFRKFGDIPTTMIILPPADMISNSIDTDMFYFDHYLLSHVVDVSDLNKGDLSTLNGSQWLLFASSDELMPGRGFPNMAADAVKITNSFMWSPGVAFTGCSAPIFVIEVDELILSSNSLKRYNWFTGSRSSPKFGSNNEKSRELISQESSTSHAHSEPSKVETRRPLNPAHALGRNKSQQDQSMARVDYCLACLQQDVTSSEELARRFHAAVSQVVSSLVECGGTFISDPDEIEEGATLPPTSFTRADVYEYAEYRLSKKLLGLLDHLLAEKQEAPTFLELYNDLQDLDITQVDLPNINQCKISAFERAVNNAALVLDKLVQARSAKDMCEVFLSTLKTLADSQLGTVSADTLLGLFMLTVLRCSSECAKVLERNLYFVAHFSSQSTDSTAAKMSAGRLSYALMVVESVMLQLKLERSRLSHLSQCNRKMWLAVKGDDRSKMEEIKNESISSVTSHFHSRSVLFMAIENQNVELLKYLLSQFGDQFTKQFICKDLDEFDRTLMMFAVKINVKMAEILVYYLDSEEYVRDYLRDSRDLHGQNLAFYMRDPQVLGEFVMSCLDLEAVDKRGNTALLYHASKDNLHPFIHHCQNFMCHIDRKGNSLLHWAVQSKNTDKAAEVVGKLVKLPSCDINWPNLAGKTALVLSRSSEIRDILLDHGADSLLPTTALSTTESPYEYHVDPKAAELIVQETLSGKIEVVFKSIVLHKSITDFDNLSKALANESPTSWIPPLKVYWKPEMRKTLSLRFAPLLICQDNVRLSFYIRQLQGHATFSKSNALSEFLSPHTPGNSIEKESSKENNSSEETETSEKGLLSKEKESDSSEGNTSLKLAKEDHVSIFAFQNLAQEQLLSFRDCMTKFVCYLAGIQSLQTEIQCATYEVENRIGELAPLFQAQFLTSHNIQVYRLQTSMLPQLVESSLTQLVKHSESMQKKLSDPSRLSDELEAERKLLQDNRMKLRSLAEAKSKILWLSSMEDKRLAEINSLEQEVARGRRKISTLETQIVSTHYCLASELSSFNEFQENEILNQLKVYGQGQLQDAKDRLKHLEFAYRVIPS